MIRITKRSLGYLESEKVREEEKVKGEAIAPFGHFGCWYVERDVGMGRWAIGLET